MREYGAVRWNLGATKEEVEASKPYLGQARVQLGIMKNLMALGNQQQGTRAVTLPDGTVIRSQSVMGQDTVQITPTVAAVAAVARRQVLTPSPSVRISRLDTTGPPKNGHQAVWDHDMGRMLVYSGYEEVANLLPAARCNTITDTYTIAVREEYIVHSIDPPLATHTADFITYSTLAGEALYGMLLPTITATPSTNTDEFTTLVLGEESWSSTAGVGAWYSYGQFGYAQADGWYSDTLGGSNAIQGTLSFAGPMLDAGGNPISDTYFPGLPGGAADFFADVTPDPWGDWYSKPVRYWYREKGGSPVAKVRVVAALAGVYPPSDWMNHSDAYHYADGLYDYGKSNALWQWDADVGWMQLPSISYAEWQAYLSLYGGSIRAPASPNPLVAALHYEGGISNTTYVAAPDGKRYAFGGVDAIYSDVRYVPGTDNRPQALNALVEYYYVP